jgi:chromosome segregation ATPase
MEIQRLKNLYLNKILKHINKVNNELKLYNQCKEQTGGSDEVSVDNTNIQFVSVLEARINKLATLNLDKKNTIVDLRSELASTTQQLVSTTQQLQQKQIELDQKQLELQMSHGELKTANDDLIAKRSELDIMRNKLTEIMDELKKVEGSNDGNLGSISELKTEISELRTNISKLKDEISSLKQEAVRLNQEVHGLNQEVDSLTQQIETLNQQIETLNQEVRKLTEENFKKDNMISELQKERGELKQHIDNILLESISSLTENNQKLIDSTNNYIKILVSQINGKKIIMKQDQMIDPGNYVISNDNPAFNMGDSLDNTYTISKNFYKNKLEACNRNINTLKNIRSETDQKMKIFITSMQKINDD